jgi:hypothetical protein
VVDVQGEAGLVGVEILGAVDVRDRHDHELELEVHVTLLSGDRLEYADAYEVKRRPARGLID